MIKNEKQYKITRNQLKKLESAINYIEVHQGSKIEADILKKAERDALRSQIEDLRFEINEYEELQSGTFFLSELNSIAELPHTLIKARIALGLTHKELGDLLNLKEQQIQRYEATDYKTANLSRVFEIMQALEIKHKMKISVASYKTSVKSILEKLKKAGLDYDFITKRLLPPDLSQQIENDLNKDLSTSSGAILQISSIISKIFNWKLSDIIGEVPLNIDLSRADCPNFKKRKKTEKKRFDAYVVYAHYLSLAILESTINLPQKDISNDPFKVRQAILRMYGEISFTSVLKYVWTLGIPVLPLKGSGAFHGACWRIDGRNIIVLKQKTSSQARWLFDILHELWHVAQNPENKKLSVIEPATDDIEYSESTEEIEANQFAGNVILDGRAEEITEICVKEAKGKVEHLKNAIIKISKIENVPVDSLAYYIAFRLSLQNINWWGAAENLQSTDTEPWMFARNVLLEQRIFDNLNRIDKNLLMQALLSE